MLLLRMLSRNAMLGSPCPVSFVPCNWSWRCSFFLCVFFSSHPDRSYDISWREGRHNASLKKRMKPTDFGCWGLAAPRNILFRPCRHVCSCATCAENLDRCPVCREPAEVKESVYVPWEKMKKTYIQKVESKSRSAFLFVKSRSDFTNAVTLCGKSTDLSYSHSEVKLLQYSCTGISQW